MWRFPLNRLTGATRSREAILVGICAVLAVLSGQMIATRGTDWGAQFILHVALALTGGWLVLTRPAYLMLLAIVTSSTLPVIVEGQLLSIAGEPGGTNVRLEYVLFVVLIFLFLIRQKQTGLRAPLDGPILAFMIIQCFSVVVASVRGYPFSPGPVIGFLEGYAFYFFASRLTSRDQIPNLARWMIAIAAVVAAAVVVTTITGSQYLYTYLFSVSPDKVQQTSFYSQFFAGYQTPRIGYGVGLGDSFLPSALVLSLVMIVLGKRWGVGHVGVVLLIAARALVSGQRYWVVFLAVAMLLPVALLALSKKGLEPRVLLRWLVLLGVLAFILVWLFSTEVWATKIKWLVIRSADTLEYVTGPGQTYGIRLAWAQLMRGPLGFVTGFGYSAGVTGADLNLGLLGTIYKLGLVGLVVMFWVLGASVIQAWKLLQVPSLRPVERGLACAVLVFLGLQFFGGFIRGAALTGGAGMIHFSIMLGWVQVVWLDATSQGKVGDAH